MAAVLSVIGYILLGLVLLLLLLLFTPLRIRVNYIDEWRVGVYLFGVIPIYRVSPTSKKSDAQQPSSPSAAPASENANKNKKNMFRDELSSLYKEEGVTGVTNFFKTLLRLCTTALRRICRFITVRQLSLCIRVGGEEADKTALLYGGVCAGLFPTLSALSSLIRIRKKRVLVQPDFLAESSSARMRLIVWVWPFGVLFALLCLFFGFLSVRIKSSARSSSSAAPRSR